MLNNPDFTSRYNSELPPMPGLDVSGKSRGLNSEVGGGAPSLVGAKSIAESSGGGVPGSSASDSTTSGSATAGLSGMDTMGQDQTDAGVPGYQSPTPGSLSEKASNAVAKGMSMGLAGSIAQAGAAAHNPGVVDKPSALSVATNPLGFFGPNFGIMGLALNTVDKIAQAFGFGAPEQDTLAGLSLGDFPGLSIGTDLSGMSFGGPTPGSPESFGVSIGDTSIGDPGSFGGDMSGGEADNSDSGGLGGLGN